MPPRVRAQESSGPLIAVPPVVGIERQVALQQHAVLVEALRERFGPRVIDAGQVVEAQKTSRVWPQALLTAEGVARLAAPLKAERVIVVAKAKRGTRVLVYAVVGEEATRKILLAKIRADKIGTKEAKRIALTVERKANVLLRQQEAAVSIDLGEMSLGEPAGGTEADAPATAPAEGQADSTITFATIADDAKVSDDILEEERREATLAAQRKAAHYRLPSIAVATGFGLGRRSVDIGGAQSSYIIPVESGALPTWSVYLTMCPLRFLPILNRSPLTDLALDVHFRRGLFGADYEGRNLEIQDDELVGRLSYRVPLLDHAFSPSLGLGIGGGWDRTEVQCCVPAPSVRYLFAEGHLRASQPLWPPILAAEGVVALRQVLGNPEAVVMNPAWQVELWLVARIAPVFFVRAGARSASYGGWRGSAFAIEDRRTYALLEVGGYF